jgi:hypothetical protein
MNLSIFSSVPYLFEKGESIRISNDVDGEQPASLEIGTVTIYSPDLAQLTPEVLDYQDYSDDFDLYSRILNIVGNAETSITIEAKGTRVPLSAKRSTKAVSDFRKLCARQKPQPAR